MSGAPRALARWRAPGSARALGREERPSTTSIHPRALLVWSLAALTVALVADNPVYRAVVALVALDVLQRWIAPGRRMRPLLLAATFAAALAVVISALASHTGADVIVRLPDWLPLAGGPVTLESVAYGVEIGLGLFAALLTVAPLSLALEAHDIVDAMPRALERTGIALAASLNLVSGLGRTFAAVRDAQRLRGWRPRGPLGWHEVLVPVLLTAIEDAVQLAESMEARAFGSGRRTSFGTLRWTALDVATALSAALAAVVVVGLEMAGAAGEWYPYPTLELPAVSAATVLGCLVLAVPAVWPRPAPPAKAATR